MNPFITTVEYKVVVGLITDDPSVSETLPIDAHRVLASWQYYAMEYYKSTDVYVSAMAMDAHAIYNEEWGCPWRGEKSIVFLCTANPKFIKDFDLYEEGVIYIANKLKSEFKQHTITITRDRATEICYLTDEEKE